MKPRLMALAGALLLALTPVVAAADQESKTMSAKGTVSAVSGTSLTIKDAKGETTFTIDDQTKVIGTGVGTKSKQKTAAGEKTVITDFVNEGDSVTVSYHESGGTKHAGQVRVTRKVAKK